MIEDNLCTTLHRYFGRLAGDTRTNRPFNIQSVCQQGRQDLIRNKAPSFSSDSMSQQRRRRHPPGPPRRLLQMWVDGASIAQIIDATTEEGLHRSSEIKGDGARGDHSDACGLESCRCIALVWLRGPVRVILGSDSSRASAGAGCHLISLYSECIGIVASVERSSKGRVAGFRKTARSLKVCGERSVPPRGSG